MSKDIIVVKNQDGITSFLSDISNRHDFDIDLILGDFVGMQGVYDEQGDSWSWDHPFATIYTKYKWMQEIRKNEVEEAIALLDDLMKMVHQNPSFPEDIFNSILATHDLELDHRFLNPYNSEIRMSVPVKELKKYLDGDYRIIYQCDTVSSMVASVLHYYLLNGYHFVKCLHCGKYYANHHRKVVYCHRISPYVDKHSQKTKGVPKTCADEVKAARKQLRRRVARIYHKIESKPKYQTQGDKVLVSLFNEFSETTGRYLDLMERESSIQLLTEFNDYLEKIETMEVLKE